MSQSHFVFRRIIAVVMLLGGVAVFNAALAQTQAKRAEAPAPQSILWVGNSCLLYTSPSPRDS